MISLMNMKFKIKQLKLFYGDIIEIREAPDGKTVCPVCGILLGGDPPYRAVINESNKGTNLPEGAASFDICPMCKTQYGEDDFIEPSEKISTQQKWDELRRKWLDEIGWTPEALQQLHDNLDIDIQKPGLSL
ncbi:MAG TPA: hypothetical protein VHG71_07900 [Verrucomicrobiae bacterium]|nr:hypothetical protein [Verrucomicrobiae bacterium]